MAGTLPKFIVIQSVGSERIAYYTTEVDDVRGYVCCEEESVFHPLAKIVVEAAKISSKFVHLRFYYTNKYWARLGPAVDEYWVVASSDQPEEDTSKSSCTLFEPTFGDNGHFYLTHVQGGGRVRIHSMSSLLYVDDDKVDDNSSDIYAFKFVDWDSLVKMPKLVAFKGNNGKYLQDLSSEGKPYQQFSSESGNEKAAAYEIQLDRRGYVRVKCEGVGKFWRRNPDWIWGDSSDDCGEDVETLFWPVKVEGATIALRSAGNNHFCKRLSLDKKTNCLNAAVSTITMEAKMEVEERVLERNICDVVYRMEDARIFDEKPFSAGAGTVENNKDQDSSLTIRVAYQDTRVFCFKNSFSLRTGVKTTIEGGMPSIVDGSIEISGEMTDGFEWEKTNEETKTEEVKYLVEVPARSRARVNYVGTQGKCCVPFSYIQEDVSSSDGHDIITSEHNDGMFYGVNYYSFRFEQLEFEPL